MAEDRLTIDTRTLDDDSDLRQVEFDAEVSGERYRFAVQYDVLEALSAISPDGDAVAIFRQHADTIAELGVVALARNAGQGTGQEIVVISENDLD
ncbi:DUF1488 family protein [Sphingomonas sp. 4RDLI-65]|uniref:hypothetical protein n=1 Tax=Sphingomonas sp. 4RDLI-65 TaxID=3111641 RepID=UPI003C2848D8